ncbi:class A beta-lactamase [Salinifilum ghardaiensis]
MRFLPRAAAALLVLCALLGCTPRDGQRAVPPTQASAEAEEPDFAGLERRSDARIGVYAVDTATGAEVTHRADERWAFASTMKTFTAAAVLRDNGAGGSRERVHYTRGDLVAHSPVTEQHVDTGMTLRGLLRAAVRDSDNTAQNLLLRELGGPTGLQRWLRAIGDTTTRADRFEPALTETTPGDLRDTSTPRALAADLRSVALGDVLPPEEQEVLLAAMRDSPLTADLIQAGAPAGWRVEDKSGAADHATRNDIAVLHPPNRAPIVLVVMSDRPEAEAGAEHEDALVAEAARRALAALP